MYFRIGYGIDVHRLGPDIPLYVGGVEIPSDIGAIGHSDADVLLHAICDALLGAANLRDIGFHFPDNDPKFKGADSKVLLKEVYNLITDAGCEIGNIDCTVVLEAPKLSPYIDQIKEVIASILHIDIDKVSVKATTHEQVDSFGRSEAIKAYAACLLTK